MEVGSETKVAGEVMGEKLEGEPAKEDAVKKEGRWWVWPVVGVAVAFLFLAGKSTVYSWSFVGEGEEVTWGELIKEWVYYPAVLKSLGVHVGIALIVSGVIAGMTANERRPMRRWWPRYFAVVLVLVTGWMFVSSVVALNKAIADRDLRVKREMAETMRGFAEGRVGVEDLAESIGEARPGATSEEMAVEEAQLSAAEYEKLTEFIRGFVEEDEKLSRRYGEAMEAAGFGRLVESTRLGADSGLKESRALVSEARKIAERFRDEAKKHYAGLPERVKGSDLGREAKHALLGNSDAGVPKIAERAGLAWSLEISKIEKVGEVIDFLAESPGRWVVEGDELMFRNEADLKTYQAKWAEVEKVGAKQSELKKDWLVEASWAWEN
jgi:hypothetical protein